MLLGRRNRVSVARLVRSPSVVDSISFNILAQLAFRFLAKSSLRWALIAYHE